MIVLERFAYTPVGTFGRMYLPSGAVLFTCEDPDNNNQTGISCIPEGEYLCVPSVWHKYDMRVYEITNIPGRSRCLIHTGNSDEDVEGCVIVGNLFPVWLDGKGLSIGDSRRAHARFMTEAAGNNFTLCVRPYTPTAGVRPQPTQGA